MDPEKTAPNGPGEDDKVVAPVSAQWRRSEGSASISDSIARGKDAVGAAGRDLASNIAERVSGVAGDLADKGANAAAAATAQAKTFTIELEAIARRNPLGAIAGAVAVGALFGMLRRRR